MEFILSKKSHIYCLTQFELAIATESNLFRRSLLHGTSRYSDLDSVKKKLHTYMHMGRRLMEV